MYFDYNMNKHKCETDSFVDFCCGSRSKEKLINNHLTESKRIFNDRLIFKHHILLHYPTVIRTMGPPIYTTMMRMEAKHKVFTDLARKTQNFVNITKTLANRHQENICNAQFNYLDKIETSKKNRKFKDCNQYNSVISSLSNNNSLNLELFTELNFFKFNGYRYEKDLIVVKDDMLFEIEHILSCGDKFYFILIWIWCIDETSHSIKVENEFDSRRIIDFNDIQTKRPYEKIYLKGKIYVPALTLHLPFV